MRETRAARVHIAVFGEAGGGYQHAQAPVAYATDRGSQDITDPGESS